MVMSIDGKVTGDFLSRPECETPTEIYYQINRDYHANAFACGRVTMEESFTHGYQPDLSNFADISIQREDHIADKNAAFFAVAFDRYGKLGWTTSKIVDEDPGYGNAPVSYTHLDVYKRQRLTLLFLQVTSEIFWRLTMLRRWDFQ